MTNHPGPYCQVGRTIDQDKGTIVTVHVIGIESNDRSG